MIFESRNSSARTSTPVHFDELYLRQLPPNVIEVHNLYSLIFPRLLLLTFLKNRKFYSCLPSSIYSWSIGHILEHEFFCAGHLECVGSKEKKVDLSFSEQLLRVVFSTFCGKKKKKNLKIF